MKCTVLVPSYNRLDCVLQLLERLQRQDYPDFDILIIEQSTTATDAQRAALAEVACADGRIRIEHYPPLGVGGARNVGMALSDADVVLIIDDDDLPATDDWISRHMVNYEDPDCIAVHGREDREDGSGAWLERNFPRVAKQLAMGYLPPGTPIALPGLRARKQNSKFLRGGNSSIRRTWALRAGGWVDECGNGQEEHDFSFRLRRLMQPGMYIAFDPTAQMIRRMDIAGGAERRSSSMAREVRGNVRFYFRVIARHQPVRFAAMLPFYPLVIYLQEVGWVLDDRISESPRERLGALAEMTWRFPGLFARALADLDAPK